MAVVADALLIELRATFDRLAGDLNGATKTLGKFEKKFQTAGNLLGKAVGVGMAVSGVLAVRKLGDELAELAARGEHVGSIEEGFRKLGGSSTQIEIARKSVLGMVSAFDLMQISNRGLIAQIPLFNENFGQISELGARLANTLGIDTTAGINQVTDALATAKPTQLAAIGIILDTDKAYQQYAAANKLAADSLSDLQKKEARQIASMGMLKAATEKLSPVTDSVANAQTAVAKAWSDGYDKVSLQINANTRLTETYRSLETTINSMDWKAVGTAIAELANIVMTVFIPAFEFALNSITAFNNGLKVLAAMPAAGGNVFVARDIVAASMALEQQKQAIDKVAQAATALQQLQNAPGGFQVTAENYQAAKSAVDNYTAALNDAGQMTTTNAGLIGFLSAKLKEFETAAGGAVAAASKFGVKSAEELAKAAAAAEKAAAKIQALKDKWEGMQRTANEKSIADGLDEAIDKLDKVSFDKWKAELEKATSESVEAALKEGLDAGVITREQADEYKRKMIDIAIDPINKRWEEGQIKANEESVETWEKLFENAITGTTFSLKDALRQIAVGFAAQMAQAIFGSLGNVGSPQGLGASLFSSIFGGGFGGGSSSGGGGGIGGLFSSIFGGGSGGASGGSSSGGGLFGSIMNGGLAGRAPGVEGPLMADGSFGTSIFDAGTNFSTIAGPIGLAVAMTNGAEAIGNLGDSAEATTDSVLTLGGTAIGAAFGGPAGAGIGSAIGHAVGSLLGDALFGGYDHPETLARMAAADQLEEVIKEVAGRGLDPHLYGDFTSPDWASKFFDTTGGNGHASSTSSAFIGVATGIADKLGLEVSGGQLAAMFADAFGGSMDMLKDLVSQTGLTFEELKGSVMSAAKEGEMSWLEAFSTIRDSQEAFEPGLAAAGDFVGAMQKLVESGGRGQKALNAIRDGAIEAGEAGIHSFEAWRASLEASGQFSSEFINGMFQGLAKAGITNFDQLEGASEETLMAIAAHMDAWLQDNGVSWADMADSITGATEEVTSVGDEIDALDGKKADVEINIKTTVTGAGAEFIKNKTGNVVMDGQISKFARGAVFNSPHTFPMSNGGIGMLGEAGPEAIMPLKRINGRLGIIATGLKGGGREATIVNIDARGAAPGVEADIRRAMRETEDRAVARATRGIYEGNRRRG